MNENYFEEKFDDMDEDIKQKEALIQEAQALQDVEDARQASQKVNQLRRKWRQIHYWESEYEEDLKTRFEQALDAFYAKYKEIEKENEAAKRELIKKAEELSHSEELKKATSQMQELFEQWKKVPSAGRQLDDALWEEFQKARQAFYDKKQAAWETMNQNFDNARQIKQDLIAKAKELEDSVEWKKTSDKLKDLMTAWREAGFAGKEENDALWEEFNAARQKFYSRRNEFYDQLHEQQAQNLKEKQALIEKARQIKDTEDYSRANTEAMKELAVEWKAIGSCGKNKDDKVWNEFREINDAYFNGLGQANAQRQQNHVNRMKEARQRKQDLIGRQKEQIQRMQESLYGLVSEQEMAEIEEQIKQKEDFIKELEEQIQDIDAKLSE
ncbi:DUF349 domain-containing protein [uncultured Faecalicoccus sp.]|uniref:DUF349 domain-containing protein n=1 Tax=uncultured Faecalicoccus sp. TaxID=1971760 RepID=UPI0026145FC3|nr:DUF349 domain-containing protein [uncultured Faecalicoccus sp.]